MTEVALGHNFLAGCCMMCCVPLYPNIVQRQAVAKKNGIESNCIEDVALSCCCGLCVLAQSNKQMGKAASILCAPRVAWSDLRLMPWRLTRACLLGLQQLQDGVLDQGPDGGGDGEAAQGGCR
jgi:hypothetical protein